MTSIGIIGLGFMAATHIKAIRELPNARLDALCNPSGRHLDGDFSNVAGNLGNDAPIRVDMAETKAYRNVEDLLADPDIQLIDICAPTHTHLDLAVAALRAGKHVLCEKPLARTSAEARLIAAAAAEAKTYFMPAMCVRFAPSWAMVKTLIDNQTYGKALAARFRRVAQPPGWGHQHFKDGKKSGGALLDLHIHDVDFVQFCFGRPLSVYSKGYSHFSGAIDHVVTQYEVRSGTIVHAEGAWCLSPGFGFNMAYTVNFERATLDFDLARGDEALKLFLPDEPVQVLRPDRGSAYAAEIAYLINCIESNRKPALVTAMDGVSAVEICEAEERSIASGKVEVL